MSAFGRRTGPGSFGAGARPQFGVARPMRADGLPAGAPPPPPSGGDQFPPLPTEAEMTMDSKGGDAMARLAERMNSTVESTRQAEGFEASVHKIKEQVLPRLLERVDPEAAATLTKG